VAGLPPGLLFSNRAWFEGRPSRVEEQGAGVVQIGVDGGGNVGKRGGKEERSFVDVANWP